MSVSKVNKIQRHQKRIQIGAKMREKVGIYASDAGDLWLRSARKLMLIKLIEISKSANSFKCLPLS